MDSLGCFCVNNNPLVVPGERQVLQQEKLAS